MQSAVAGVERRAGLQPHLAVERKGPVGLEGGALVGEEVGDDAVSTFFEGRSRYRAVGGQSTINIYQSLLAELLADAGRVNEATELVTGARRQADELPQGCDEVMLRIAEGVVAARAGDLDRAAERLAAAVALGDRDGAHAFARRAEAVADELSVPLPAR